MLHPTPSIRTRSWSTDLINSRSDETFFVAATWNFSLYERSTWNLVCKKSYNIIVVCIKILFGEEGLPLFGADLQVGISNISNPIFF